MASSLYNDWASKNGGDKTQQTVNVEFVEKTLDKAMDGHDHDGVNSPIINTSVTLDFNAGGGDVYVKTPIGSGAVGELPDSSVLSNTYTKAVIDQKLSTKSDTGHTHSKTEIVDFPTSLRNEGTLTINGQTYDGSNDVNITVLSQEDFSAMISGAINQIDTNISFKSNIGHTHTKIDITDFEHDHTKSEITDFEHDHTKSEITDFDHTHTKNDITDFDHTHMKDEITDFPDMYDKNEIDSLLSTKSDTTHVNSEIERLEDLITALTSRVDSL